MGVFPAASRSHVPDVLAELMVDPVSANILYFFFNSLNLQFFLHLGIANHRLLSSRFQY